MAYGNSVEDLLDPTEDLLIPLWLPNAFVKVANEVVNSALQDLGLPTEDVLIIPKIRQWNGKEKADNAFGLQPVYWRLSVITMWEQLDRRIDECVFRFLPRRIIPYNIYFSP